MTTSSSPPRWRARTHAWSGTAPQWRPTHAAARDVELLIERLAVRPEIDLTRIALAGHSGGAHFAVRMAVRMAARTASDVRPRIGAFAGLDTTQDYHGLTDDRWDDFTRPALAARARLVAPTAPLFERWPAFGLLMELHVAGRDDEVRALGRAVLSTMPDLVDHFAAHAGLFRGLGRTAAAERFDAVVTLLRDVRGR